VWPASLGRPHQLPQLHKQLCWAGPIPTNSTTDRISDDIYTTGVDEGSTFTQRSILALKTSTPNSSKKQPTSLEARVPCYASIVYVGSTSVATRMHAIVAGGFVG
jgi:hypothetical protein